MSYDNTNKGTIAKNSRKESDQHPDIAGSLNVNGTDFWISGWLKTNSRDGSKFYSLSVKPKQERAAEIRRGEPRREQGMYDREDRSEESRYREDADLPF